MLDSNVRVGRFARAFICAVIAGSALLRSAHAASPIRFQDLPPTCASATADGPDDAAATLFRAHWDAAVAYLAAPEHLGRSLTVPARITMCDTPSGETSLETFGVYSPAGDLTRCAIVVYPNGVSEAADDALTRASVTHEAFHCYMAALLGRDRIDATSGWLNEGAAAWAGETAVGGTSKSAVWWHSYLTAPSDPLFGRSYSAIGFFAHLAERGHDVWHQFDDLFRANSGAKPTPLGLNADQYTFALAVGDDAGALNSWPAGLARDGSLGTDWDTSGPGITDDAYAVPTVPLAASVSVPQAANDLVRLTLTEDVIRVRVDQPSGHADGKLRAADGAEYALDSKDYCARDGGCGCGAGSSPLPAIAAGDALLALSGHVPTQAVPASGSTVSVTAVALDDYCATTGEPKPPAPPAASTGVPTSARVDNADCGPWFGSGWFVSFNLGTPGGDDFWIVQVIVEPHVYAGNGTYREETDASSYGARVSVTRGDGGGYAPLVTAPEGNDMGTVSIGDDGRSGSAAVLLDDRRGGQIYTAYQWTCATVS